MEVTTQLATTKSNAAISLAPLHFEGAKGEQVVLLLQIHAHPRDAKMLEDEAATVARHSLLESDGEAWHRLDGALKELNGLFKGFLASGSVSDIHACIGFVDRDGTLHVSHAGRGEGYLIRHGGASQITEFTKGKPVPMFVHIASGELELGDTVILSTQRLLRVSTPVQLAQQAQRHTQVLQDLIVALDAEREIATLGCLHVPNVRPLHVREEPQEVETPIARRGRKQESEFSASSLISTAGAVLSRAGKKSVALAQKVSSGKGVGSVVETWKKNVAHLSADLRHPQRKKRAHLLLVAGVLALVVVVWLVFQITAVSQQSKTKAELQDIMKNVEDNLKAAESKRLLGDIDSANAILVRAEDEAKQVMSNDSGLFRSEALTLLDKVRAKKEEIGNVLRVSPRLVVNLATKNSSIDAEGLIGVSDGEFLVYDRQDTYHILLNSAEDGKVLLEGDSVLRGTMFERFKAPTFLTSGNGILEIQNGQTIVMKTEDTNGWPSGRDIETYLRYLYLLGPDGKIYKYERLSNRYGPSVQYNVNGDLTGAVDMTIDGSVYVLKENGEVVKLFRGEAQQFSMRGAPDGTLKGTTRITKVSGGNIYFLDPSKKRVVVVRDDSPAGDISYLRQYILEGDQVGTPKDLYVDADESHLYVLDEQRLHIVDLRK